jgi:predicted dehydrogenase
VNQTPKAGAVAGLARRQFLKQAALACGAAALPNIVRSSVLGLGGKTPPSERLVLGAIGVGGRGSYDLAAFLPFSEVQIVAVCEVQQDRRDTAKDKVDKYYDNKDCATFRDLRDMFAKQKGLQAVMIATGDRWHTPASLMAMKAGLDIFCEKPCTMSVVEGQALVAAAKRHKRIFQAGMQRLSEGNFVFC